MHIKILGDNFELQPRHHQLVAKLIQTKLEPYLTTFNQDMTVADVHITKRPRWGYEVNFSMVMPGKEQIFAKAVDENLETALRQLRHKVERQLKEYRGKLGITDKDRPALKEFSQTLAI